MAFPEVPSKFGLHVYDLAVGYVHSKQLRWSYAGMKGRPGDLFYRNLEEQPVEAQLTALRRFGFDAVYIDKRGYEDGGTQVVSDWQRALGSQPLLTRDDGAVVVFRLPGGRKPANVQVAHDALVPEPQAASDISLPSMRSFMGDGWSANEAWGVWSSGAKSSLRYRVTTETFGDSTLLLRGNPFLSEKQPLRIDIKVNGKTSLTSTIPAGQMNPLELRVPVTTRSPGDIVDVVIEYHDPVSPAQLGISADQRRLAFGITSMKVCKPDCSD